MPVNPPASPVYTRGEKMKSKKSTYKRKVVSDGRCNTDRVSVRLTPRQYFELNQFCKRNGMRKSNLVRELIQMFIDKIDDSDEEQG